MRVPPYTSHRRTIAKSCSMSPKIVVCAAVSATVVVLLVYNEHFLRTSQSSPSQTYKTANDIQLLQSPQTHQALKDALISHNSQDQALIVQKPQAVQRQRFKQRLINLKPLHALHSLQGVKFSEDLEDSDEPLDPKDPLAKEVPIKKLAARAKALLVRPESNVNCGNSSLSNEERELFLKMHNNLRSALARGTQLNAGWGVAPPATVMYRMKYDCKAESYAQAAVSDCRTEPLPEFMIGQHKQNIHISKGSATRQKTIVLAVATWWSKLAIFGIRSNMMFYPSERTRGVQGVDNWSKMAWWNNIRVGCALQECNHFWVTSCMYGPGGNYDYAYIYRAGETCSECPKGRCDKQFLCRW